MLAINTHQLLQAFMLLFPENLETIISNTIFHLYSHML